MPDTTISAEGRVTLPEKIREQLGLKGGDKLTFTTLSDGTIVLRAKTRRLLDLAGSLTRPSQPAVGVDQMKPFA